ncbi:MAG: efflux RND transporter periplasmic adaptor subunit [Gammaproteobacteria bacterium]|nr:efflux RND transporter periplasmic adaptor subunit [Gammaproteobacteria bacterium]
MKFKLSMLTLVVGIISLLFGCEKAPEGAQRARPMQQVDIVKLSQATLTFKQTLPGRAVASKVAQVRPQVSGIILKRHFEEGALVKAGQPLYQIDDAIYQASLVSAEAKIFQTKTNLDNAKTELYRYQSLIKDNAVSQQKLDQAQATYSAFQAQLAMDKAALNKVEVDLSYTKVLAPIDGRISKSNITQGALVTALQSQALATITQLDPIYFDLVQANGQLRDLNLRKAAGELIAVTQSARLNFGGDKFYPQQGILKFNEVQANPSTDTVTMRVEFPNADYTLLPGMYGQVELIQATRANSILVPQKAVQFNRQGQATVFMLSSDNKVELRVVTIGRSFEHDWLVLSGLSQGEQVIVSGLQKIGPGMTVAPNDVTATGSATNVKAG